MQDNIREQPGSHEPTDFVKTPKTAAASGWIGSALEYYDFFIYAQAAAFVAAAVCLPLAAWMPEDAFNSWGWRSPFLLSSVVVVAGYVIRRRVSETPAFQEEEEHGEVPSAPIVQAVRESGSSMLRV